MNNRSSGREIRNSVSTKIKRVREKDKEVVKVVEEMKKVGVRALKDNE